MLLLTTLLVTGCSTTTGDSDSSVGDDPPTADDPVAVAEHAGIALPEAAEDLQAVSLSEDTWSYRLQFTMPADLVEALCVDSGLGTRLVIAEPPDPDQVETFALPADVDWSTGRECRGMQAGTNIQRDLFTVPAGDDRVSFHAVAFEMPG